MKLLSVIGFVWGLLGVSIVVAAPASGPADSSDDYLKFVHPTIRGPYPDLLNLEIPRELENQRTAGLGYVDVTKGPFRADPTGKADSTRAIQDAINFARDHQMACFFPAGTYLISDTIECVQQLYRRSNGRVLGGNRFPNILVGSRAGARPRLLLAPHAPGFGDPEKPKIFVKFWARGYANPTTAGRVTDGLPYNVEQPNISMNQVLVNLEIAVGEGNPGAIALRHQGAEGSAIEDCTIDATGALAGIQGGIGSGGGSAGVTVIGGRVGLDFTGYLSGTQPTPTITGFTLRGQTEAAIRSTSRQAFVAAGLRIIADRCAGPLIQVPKVRTNQGQLTLVDGRIEFAGDALNKPERVAISSGNGVFLDQVYVRGATQVLIDPDLKTALPGNPEGWLRVDRFAHASRPRTDQQREYRYPVYVNGHSVDEVKRVAPGEAPPADLQSRHLWGASFPTFESAGAANVKDAPYGALGDGKADDTAAIQRAVDQNEIVFLPKGCYRLSRTLELKPNTNLIGAGQHLSLLIGSANGPVPREAAWPLVRTADAGDAETVLAFLGLMAPRDVPGVFALEWRCGGRSIFRSVEIEQQSSGGFAPRKRAEAAPAEPAPRPVPVLITGHGGGNWYNYRAARLRVDGAQGTLRFYQFSPQHVTSELLGARDVSMFGTKYEGNDPMLVARNCASVRLLGHGGNAKGRPGASLFVIENTPRLIFANGVDGPTKIGSQTAGHPEGATDPREWHMLIDTPPGGAEFKLPPLERPVLFERGE